MTSSNFKSSANADGVQNEKSVETKQPAVLEPITFEVSNIPTKTEDGGSPQAANTAGRDAFMVYSNDSVRRAAIFNQVSLLNQAADAEEEGDRDGAINPEVNQPIVRKTRLSYEVHPDLFFEEFLM